jgi:RNA polymerase sigma factor (sigma-70 family)
MAAHPRQPPSTTAGRRRLSVEEARFYASIYDSARKGSLNAVRRKGCSEEEAEEFFSTAFEKVMESVNPIAREFSAPQMVDFIKRATWHCMVDEHRRRGRRPEIEIGAVRSLSDASAESPEEVAEEREAVAIGREALQMLSERDRVIFRQRHQMNLSPEEILENMPGLSMRTYRKVIERANARVLAAFDRIEGGQRCEEMEADLLHRYVTDESSEQEQRMVEAHLAHCRACQKAQARMRGYLLDVASGLLVASSLGGTGRFGALGGLPSRLAEVTSSGAQGFAEASRAARERARDLLVRIAGWLPGSGGDASVGQALTATSVKVASACAAGVAAGTCVAAGIVPGIGGIGLLGQQHDRTPPTKPAGRALPAGERPSLIDTLPPANSPAPAQQKPQRHNGAGGEAPRNSSSSTQAPEPSAPASNSPSSARESDSVTSTEFGAESGQPAPAPPPPSPPSGSSESPSSGNGASQGGSSPGSGSEFGL